VAKVFTLSFQLFTYVVARGCARTLRGGVGAVIVIIIVVVVLGNLVIRLRPINVEAGLAHCLVLQSLQNKQTLLKPAG
jgi:hypothetical protein